ncbi:MAG: polysaccharide deacetylase family protein [Verrucomicrobiales bacterium]|nr:polysaccharide deacetylase family protein [Verrucomicrobiales bacterium]
MISKRFFPRWCWILMGGLAAVVSGSVVPLKGVTFAERLGWSSTNVVVILHVDDAGMHHASNRGVKESLENGVATSFAIMMPCPWVPEIARYVKDHPGVDAGLHLTLTAEWEFYRWGPLAGRSAVPGLTDPEGCLWRNVAQVVAKATPDEVERELRAQLARAEALGLDITHLDSHMGTLFAKADFFERFVRIGVEKRLPILAIGGHMTYARVENGEATEALKPWVPKIWNAGLPVLDDLHTGSYGWPPAEKTARLTALLRELKPGVTEILFHASVPTDDFPRVTGSSESRHADTKALTAPEVRQVIAERGIILTTWRELMARRSKAAPM